MFVTYGGQTYSFTNVVDMLALIGWLRVRDSVDVRVAA